MDEALALNRGVIAVTAHIGHWEAGGYALGLLGYPVHAVALKHRNSHVNQLFVEQRRAKGLEVIDLGASSRELFHALKRNEVLAIVADRVFDAREKSLKVSWFNQLMLVPRGPAALSVTTGAPIIPVTIVMNEDLTYEVRCHAPLRPDQLAQGSKDQKSSSNCWEVYAHF